MLFHKWLSLYTLTNAISQFVKFVYFNDLFYCIVKFKNLNGTVNDTLKKTYYSTF